MQNKRGAGAFLRLVAEIAHAQSMQVDILKTLLTAIVVAHLAGCDSGTLNMSGSEQLATFRVTSQLGQPTLANGAIYVGTDAGVLHAVEKDTGRELWQFAGAGSLFHPPLLSNNLVLFGSADGWLRAVDAESGNLVWGFEAGRVDWEVRDIFINGKPSVVDGIAYFSSEDFNVYAVEVASGQEVWRHKLDEEPQAREIPIVDRTAYIGDWSGHLYALDIDTGQRIWRSVTDDVGRASLPDQVPFVTVVPIVTDEAVYFTDWAGNLFAVDRANGQQIWRFDPGAADSRHVGSRSFMALVEDVLYYSTVEDKHLYGIDRLSGEQTWVTETDGVAYGPVNAGGSICLYFEVLEDESGASSTMHMRAIDMGSHEVLWSANDPSAGPTVSDGVVYYGSTDGAVYGRDLTSGEPVFRLGH